MEDNKKKTKKLFTATMASLGVFLIILALLQLSIWPLLQPKQAEASIYSPFGGKVENYTPESEAQCVKKSCGKINNTVQNAVKKVLTTTTSPVIAALAAIPVYGWAAAAAVEAAVQAFPETINVCVVEEITVGKPMPAKVGILKIGEFIVSFKGKTIFKVSLSDLFDFSVIAPTIYRYKKYDKEGAWVLGDSLDVLKVCKKAGKLISEICDILKGDKEEAGQESYDNAISKGMSEEDAEGARTNGEEEYSKDCPFMNLLHQVGTSKEPILKKLINIIEQAVE
jgi:hypothetical protein